MSTNAKTNITVAVVVLLLASVFWVVWLRTAPKTTIRAEPSASASSSAAPIPTLSQAPSADATEPPQDMAPIAMPTRDFYVHGNGMQADILVRGDAGWSIPYPAHLVVHACKSTTTALDCGFFPTVHGDGWRVAYCLDNGKRVARRLYLMALRGPLDVTVMDKSSAVIVAYKGLEPGGCE